MVIYKNRPIIYGGAAGIDNQILEVINCGLSSIGTLPFSFNSGLCALTESKVTNGLVEKRFPVKCESLATFTSCSFGYLNQSDGIFLCDYFDSVRLCRRTIADEPTGPFEDYGYSFDSHYKGAMAAGDGAGSKSQKLDLLLKHLFSVVRCQHPFCR